MPSLLLTLLFLTIDVNASPPLVPKPAGFGNVKPSNQADCTIVKNAWAAMGKPAKASTVDCCEMDGVTCEGSSVTQIQWVERGLKGPIPSSLGNLAQLKVLNLADNQLTGPIPSTFGTLSLLTALRLCRNKLSGPIPSSLGTLTQLVTLSLNDNQLTGPIPSSLGNLVQLKILLLLSNKLSGPIPSSLGNLADLTLLSLTCNELTGPIPSSLGNLAQLKQLNFGNNQLTGPIPSTFGNLAQLIHLLLPGNSLSGPIPSSLGNLAQLTSMSLADNQLNGTIPSSLGNLAQLNRLALHMNKLTGPIPSSFGNLKQLTNLYLQKNQLTEVPSSLEGLVNCTEMALLPNPMSVPYDLLVKSPVSTMQESLTDFLATPKLVKKELSSSVATLTTEQLLAKCPLNYVANQDILAGCVAGIVYFCQGKTDLAPCQRYYDTVFSYSIFAPIGAYCPAWKSGPNSTNCNNAVSKFKVSLEYTTVDKEFASFFAKTLFANKDYAPCTPTANVRCIW